MMTSNIDQTVGSETAIKLKSTVYTKTIRILVAELRMNWEPKMRTLTGKPYKGVMTVNEPYDVLYWDIISLKWTHREAAFKSYVFKELEKYIKY